MKYFKLENFISDEMLKNIQEYCRQSELHTEIPTSKQEIYDVFLDTHARQIIAYEFLIDELNKIADRIIKAIKEK